MATNHTVHMCIGLVFATAFLAGCATQAESPGWEQAYRNCSKSAQSYFRGIPIASRKEHEQAERFAPIDTNNCMIYTFANWSSGSKSAHASIFLYRKGTEPPPIPKGGQDLFGLNTLAHPRWSERHLRETPSEFRKAEIFAPDVYATWELVPGSYVLDASTFIFSPFARTVISCKVGHTAYMAFDKETLKQIDEAEGRKLAHFHLRSSGKQPGGPLSSGWIGDRKCLEEK